MFILIATTVLVGLALAAYLIAAQVRTQTAPLTRSAEDARFRRDAIQLAAHVLAADDSGWVLPDHITARASELLEAGEQP